MSRSNESSLPERELECGSGLFCNSHLVKIGPLGQEHAFLATVSVTSLATPPRAPEAVRLLQPNAPQPLTLLRPFILGGLLPVGIDGEG